MSLQYLSNINPPPAQSRLEYDLSPGTVYISTATQQLYVNLTITVSNLTSAPVDCLEFQFGFLAGAATGNLTTATEAGAVTPVSDQDEWSIVAVSFDNQNPDLCMFTATPSGLSEYLSLAPGASLVFHLNDIAVDESVGEGAAPFTIIEQTGPNHQFRQTVQGTLTLTKKLGTLAIEVFNVSPPTPIDPGSPIEFSWTLVDSDHWQLYDADTATLLYDSNTSTPPNLTQWPVPPQQVTPEQTTNYRLIAWAGQSYAAQGSEAMVKIIPPKILSFSASPQVYQPRQSIDLLWQTESAWSASLSQVILGSPDINNLGPVDLQSNGYAVPPTGISLYFLTASNQLETIRQTVAVPAGQTIGLSGLAESIVYDDQNNLVWVLDYAMMSGTTLKAFNPVDNSLKQAIGVGYDATGLIFDGTYLWAANKMENSVSQILASTGAVVRTTPVGNTLWCLVYDPVNKLIWAGSAGDNTVSRIDAITGAVIGNPVAVAEEPLYMTFDGSNVWATGGSRISMMATSRNPTIEANTLPAVPGNMLCITFDGSNVWAGAGDTTAKKFDSKGNVLASYPAGNYPDAIVGDGKHIWTANLQDQTVTMLLAEDGTVLATIPVPAMPENLGFDGSALWVGINNSDDTGYLLKFGT